MSADVWISPEGWKQIGLLVLETVFVALLLAALFKGRRRFGLSPLFATLGVFQYLQVMLAYSLYVEVVPGVSVSPGSVVLFSGSLFGLLLVFLRESPEETKTLVYGLFAANLSLSLLSLILALHLDSPLLRNPYSVPDELFRLDVKIMIIGTLTLVLDMLLMIYLYPLVERFLKSSFIRAAVTLCAVLTFDSIVFFTGAFAGESFALAALGATVAAKLAAGLIYAAMLAAYLRWVEPSPRLGRFATPGQVMGFGSGTWATQSRRRIPPDLDLGILPAAYFAEVSRQLLAIGEQIDSEVAVFVFRVEPQTHEPEHLELLRYLLAVLRGNLSQKAVYGRYGQTDISAAVPSTNAGEAERILRKVDRALAEALERVRPTATTQSFTIQAGVACSPGDGSEPEILLSLASQRASVEGD